VGGNSAYPTPCHLGDSYGQCVPVDREPYLSHSGPTLEPEAALMSNTSVSGMLQVTLLTTVVSDREAILLLVILGLHVSVGMMCGSWGDRSQNAPLLRFYQSTIASPARRCALCFGKAEPIDLPTGQRFNAQRPVKADWSAVKCRNQTSDLPEKRLAMGQF
jgi:hypothetical protein